MKRLFILLICYFFLPNVALSQEKIDHVATIKSLSNGDAKKANNSIQFIVRLAMVKMVILLLILSLVDLPKTNLNLEVIRTHYMENNKLWQWINVSLGCCAFR